MPGIFLFNVLLFFFFGIYFIANACKNVFIIKSDDIVVCKFPWFDEYFETDSWNSCNFLKMINTFQIQFYIFAIQKNIKPNEFFYQKCSFY